MGALDTLREITSSLRDSNKAVEDTKAIFTNLGAEIENSMAGAAKSGNRFSKAFKQLSDGISSSDPSKSIKKGFESMSKDVEYFSTLLSNMSGPLGEAFGVFGASAAGMGEEFGDLIENTMPMLRAFDQASSEVRRLERNFGRLGQTMGYSFEDTKKFTEQMMEMMSYEGEEFFITPQEIEAATQAFMKQSFSLEELTESFDMAGRSASKQEAALMTARATGEDLSTTVRFLSDSVQKSGMTFEDAIAQYGAISDVAKETGLQFDTVKDALTGAVSGFESMGVKMGFAQPIFEGFTRSLQKVGLGIKNASGEARAFVNSMINMTSSYENMFLLQQRGGLETGSGGGALGASIGMRARILEAESTGDQSAIGLEMANSLKETLESFTGGEIVTLQEAADSPELQSTFYVQEQLLSQFGISGRSAERTLELLEGLDEAKAIGDEESVQKFGEMIDNELKREDETLGEAEKTNRLLNQISAQMTYGNELSKAMITIRESQADTIGTGSRGLIQALSDKQKEFSEKLAEGTNIEDLTRMFKSDLEDTTAKFIEDNAGADRRVQGQSKSESTNIKTEVVISFKGDSDKLFEALDATSGIVAVSKEQIGGP